MLEGISSSVSHAIRSEDNLIGRMTGKSVYELCTGKKPYPLNYYGKKSLKVAKEILVLAMLHELSGRGRAGPALIDKGGDLLLKGMVKAFGKSPNPLAHSAIRVSSEIISSIGNITHR